MSKMVKVICECSGVTPEGDYDEGNLKIAEIRSDWENTSSGWKAFHILMCIPTGAVWVGLILAKMFFMDKEIICLSCERNLDQSCIRSF